MTSIEHDIFQGPQFEDIIWDTTDNITLFPGVKDDEQSNHDHQRPESTSIIDGEQQRLPPQASPPGSTMKVEGIDLHRSPSSEVPLQQTHQLLDETTHIPRQNTPSAKSSIVHKLSRLAAVRKWRSARSASEDEEHHSHVKHTVLPYPFETGPMIADPSLQMMPCSPRTMPRHWTWDYPLAGTNYTARSQGTVLVGQDDGSTQSEQISGSTKVHPVSMAARLSLEPLPQRASAGTSAQALMAQFYPASKRIEQHSTASHRQRTIPKSPTSHESPHTINAAGQVGCRQRAAVTTAFASSTHPADILELVVAIKALGTGSNGYPFRKHLKDRQNPLIRQHFCSQLGILRIQSPLRVYHFGDTTLFDEDYWIFLTEVQRRPRRQFVRRPGQPY